MNSIRKLYRKIVIAQERATFEFCFPYSLVAVFTNPFYFVRKNLYKNIYDFSQYLTGKLLDFGCGCKPYQKILSNCSEYIGVDIEQSGHDHKDEKIDVFYDGKTLPFENESFDSIFSSEVFEHVSNFDDILLELNRVLKMGGYMVSTVPFVWNEHEIPYDFQRFSSYGIKNKLENAGFKVEIIKKSTAYMEILFQMYMEYLRGSFANKVHKRRIQKLFQIFIIMPVTLTPCVRIDVSEAK